MKEIKRGTTFLIVDLVSRCIKVQTLFLAVQFILGIIGLETEAMESTALGVWFNYMTVFCWLNPKPMKLCCFNIKFSRQFYPFIFGSILTLLSWSIRVDMVTGILLGLVQCTLLKNTKDLLQPNHYQSINSIVTKTCLSTFKNWTPLHPTN